MNPKNLLTTRIKSAYKMDRTSHRYRKCPNDGYEFMTDNLSRIYCSDHCADEFHNQKKRDAENKLLEDDEVVIAAPLVPQTMTQSDAPLDKAKENVRIIDTLTLDPVKGSVFNIDWLYSLGFDFSAFNGQGELYNIDKNHNCHFLQIANYRLFRVEFSEVLIKKII